VVSAHQTIATNALDGLPSQVRPVFSSVYNAEYSILTANGFVITGTSQAAAAEKTGAIKAAGAMAAGMVGLMMAL